LLRPSQSLNTLGKQQEAAVVSRSTGSPEKAAYNVFIAVLPGKKVALCAVGRNFDMMSDFLHRGRIVFKAL
jgi:hypothetical protein